MRLPAPIRFAVLPALLAVACTSSKPAKEEPAAAPAAKPAEPAAPEPKTEAPKPAAGLPDDLPTGLLLSYSQFQVVDGRATANPGPARLDIVTRAGQHGTGVRHVRGILMPQRLEGVAEF